MNPTATWHRFVFILYGLSAFVVGGPAFAETLGTGAAPGVEATTPSPAKAQEAKISARAGAQTDAGAALEDDGGGQSGSESKQGAAANATGTVQASSPAATGSTASPSPAKAKGEKKGFFEKLYPILLLLIVVSIVVARLPKVKDVTHSDAFRRRRLLNWLPLGLTYAFLYMGRYNLSVSQLKFGELRNAAGGPLMDNSAFAGIFAAGTIVYGISFLINGPLTDRLGGKMAILAGAGGACAMNLLMAVSTWSVMTQGPLSEFLVERFVLVYSVLYAANMYFQSFGAVAIVKVNAAWFHLRERGVFGAIFGILISLGVYFAYDVGYMILGSLGLLWVFAIPAILLAIFWVLDFFLVCDTPGEAGLADFDTADASSGDDGPRLSAGKVFTLMFRNPVIVTIALIEFCSGFLRQAIMQWYRNFAKQTDAVLHLKGDFVYDNWGMLLCCAGIMGGVVAGIISDHLFQSRRGPVAGVLYGIMVLGAILLTLTYQEPFVGWIVVFMSMAVIGVHGMLSGTASMDFGGKKNVGVAVGIIDGFVYAGTGFMSMLYREILPQEQLNAAGKIVGPAADPANWNVWPASMVPVAAIGFFLALRVWNARPQRTGT